MEWKKALKLNQEIVLSTTSTNGNPHAIVVISKDFIGNKLLINACQMSSTLKNLRKNNNACIVVKWGKNYYRIKGEATIYSSGKYFDIAVKRNKPPPVKYAILIDIKEVFDLDKVIKIL